MNLLAAAVFTFSGVYLLTCIIRWIAIVKIVLAIDESKKEKQNKNRINVRTED
jgi:hypothetical protein